MISCGDSADIFRWGAEISLSETEFYFAKKKKF
jgi:hypothetical protein